MMGVLKWLFGYEQLWGGGAKKLSTLLLETKPDGVDVILLHRTPDGLTHYGTDLGRRELKHMLQQAADRIPGDG
jgi:hypothetical protein